MVRCAKCASNLRWYARYEEPGFLSAPAVGVEMNIHERTNEFASSAVPAADASRRADSVLAGSWPLIVLLCLAILPYAGNLRNDFTYSYDDKALILDSPYVHSFQHLGSVFTRTLFSNLGAQAGAPYYRPLTTLGFLLCYQLFGPWALGFHLVSLLLNAAAVGLVYLLAKEMFPDRVSALVSAGLFALHPVHVEPVAWISGVSDVEVTAFCLLTFWCFLRLADLRRGRRQWMAAAMTVSFVLAIFTKEQAVTVPALAAVYEHFYRADRLLITRLQKALRYAPLWLVAFAYALLRVGVMGSFTRPTAMHSISTSQMLLSAVALAGHYLGKLVWPVRLSAFYPFHASASLLAPGVMAGMAALLACAWLVVFLWKRSRTASFGIVWLVVTLAPVLNARWMSSYVFGERYLYLPSVGFCLVAGWTCGVLCPILLRSGRQLRIIAGASACILVVLAVLHIGMRVLDWRDDITLFSVSLAAEPGDPRLHDALGLAFRVRGEPERAEHEWLETLRLNPESVQTLDSLGALYAEQRRFREAIPLLRQALRLNPRDANAHLNLGAACAETGDTHAAEEHLVASLALSPLNFNAHNVLGKLYFDSQRLDGAEQQFRQSLRCEPNLAAYDHLGYIYMRWEDRERAEKVFKAALAMNGRDGHAHFNLGIIYAAAGRTAKALEELQAARVADPGNPEVLSALEKLRR